MFNFLKIDDDWKQKFAPIYPLVRNIMFISALFVCVVSTILIINYSYVKDNEPIQNSELEQLIKKAHQFSDNDDLQIFIRNYDAIVRKSYFTDQRFRKFGALLLSIGFILFLISLKIVYEFKRDLPKLRSYKEDSFKNLIFTEYFFLTVFLLFLFAAFLISLKETPDYANTKKKERIKRSEVSPKISEEDLKSNWPSFRGFGSMGIAYAQEPPVKWSGKDLINIKWKVPLDLSGFNSPVIWKDQIFISGADKNTRKVYSYDFKTGKLNWSKSVTSKPNLKVPSVTNDTGLAASTMTTNGINIGAIFATGEIIVLNMSGEIQWEHKLETPVNHYGHSSSLISYKNTLYVQYDHGKSANLYAFDFSTGRLKWQRKREVDISWTSPILAPYSAGKKQLVLISVPFIISYNPDNGSELWRATDLLSGELGPSAAYHNEKIFVANEYAELVALDSLSGEIKWQYDENLPDASSPVAFDNYLILPSTHGVVTCMNSETGEIYFYHEFPEGFYASPVIADKKVYLLDKRGVMQIFMLDNKFKLIGSPEIGEPAVSTPVFYKNNIIIKSFNNLFCIGVDNE